MNGVRKNDVAVRFTIQLPRNVPIDASTVNGGLQIDGVSAPVEAATVNGRIAVNTSTGPVQATTVNGSIEANMQSLTSGDVRLTTVNGSVSAGLPVQINANIDAETVNGRVETDFPVKITGKISPRHLRGTIGTGGATLDTTGEPDWDTMIGINLSGVWKTVKAGVPHVLSGGNGGSIILTSSVGGLKAYPNTGHYIAAKHGVIGLMRTFAVELGAHSIRVNAVCPTNVNTPMFMNEGTMRLFRPDLENPGVEDFRPVAQFMHVLPIGWVEPVDISNAVLFLASDEARYITGLPMTVDAGSTLK